LARAPLPCHNRAVRSLGWVIAFAGALLAATPTWAGKADVLTVEARQTDAEQ
jgi:hypothetical protein